MPCGYQHLTRTQRCQIELLKSRGAYQYEIASQLGVSPSTISRELNRNITDIGHYDFHDAHAKAQVRRWRASSTPNRMTPKLISRIVQGLKSGWSPEQIAGRLKREGLQISHESIYQHIWRNKRENGSLYLFLRRRGRRYKNRVFKHQSRSRIPGRIDISERPPIVETKARVGDWEGDTIIGKGHQGAILSYVDRKSKFTLLSKLNKKKAKAVVLATLKRLSRYADLTHTITYDNGSEFSAHQTITQHIGATCYFATPYHAWERGLNEHTNGLVRQYFPKSTNLNLITDRELKHVENLLNNRPRKVLGYRTPREVFEEALLNNQKIALRI